MRRIALCASVVICVLSLAAPARAAGPRGWPGFQVGLGADIPLGDLLGGVISASPQVRFNFGRGFVIANFAYTVTSMEEKGNEDIDPGHDFTVAVRGGYYLVGNPTTHLGLGGSFGVHGVGPVNGDVGAAISIAAGVFPEAFLTEGFAITGFIGMGFEFYTDDATAQIFNVSRSVFRFSLGQATPLITMGFVYYF